MGFFFSKGRIRTLFPSILPRHSRQISGIGSINKTIIRLLIFHIESKHKYFLSLCNDINQFYFTLLLIIVNYKTF